MLTAKSEKVKSVFLVKSNKRGHVEREVEYDQFVKIPAIVLGDIGKAKTVEFEFRTGNSAYRLSENPLVVEFACTKKVTVTADGADDIITYPPNNNTVTRCYLPDVLGPCAFVKCVTVSLDGTELAKDTTGYQGLYQSLNRRLCKKQTRKEMGVYTILNTETDLVTKKDALVASCATSLGTKLVEGGIDGVPFLSKPRNHALEGIMPQRGANCSDVIPPGSVLSISLIMHDDPTIRCGKIDTEGSLMFVMKKDANTGADAQKRQEKPPDFNITIKSMWLTAEKLSYGKKSEIMSKVLKRDPMDFYFDAPRYSVQGVVANRQHTSTTHSIPVGANLAYVCFMQGFQLHGDTIHKRFSDVSLFPWPTGLSKITVKLEDQVIQFPDGLTVKNQSDPSVSCDMLVYFNWLKDRGLVEGSYRDWSGSSRMGFNNVFIYDLSIYGTKSSKKLEVETLFQNGKLSPEGFYCAVVLPIEVQYSRTSQNTWDVKEVK